ncbi:unnamed protein product, partial [Vitis vinifera]
MTFPPPFNSFIMNSTTTLTLSISLLYNVALEFIQDRLHFFVGIAGTLSKFDIVVFLPYFVSRINCPLNFLLLPIKKCLV